MALSHTWVPRTSDYRLFLKTAGAALLLRSDTPEHSVSVALEPLELPAGVIKLAYKL